MTLFQGILKMIINRHRGGDFMSFLGDFFQKKKEFATKYLIFRKQCRLLVIS